MQPCTRRFQSSHWSRSHEPACLTGSYFDWTSSSCFIQTRDLSRHFRSGTWGTQPNSRRALYLDFLVAQRPVQEHAHGALCGFDSLPLTVRIRQPENRRLDSVPALVHLQELLDCKLDDAVGHFRGGPVPLVHRQMLWRTVDRAAGRDEDDPPNLPGDHRIQKQQAGDQVGPHVLGRIVVRTLRQRGADEVEYSVRAFDRFAHFMHAQALAGQPFDRLGPGELPIRLDSRSLENTQQMPVQQQPISNRRADESTAAEYRSPPCVRAYRATTLTKPTLNQSQVISPLASFTPSFRRLEVLRSKGIMST